MQWPENPWLWLVFAGLCEIVYALAMPHTRGFTQLGPTVFALVFVALSMYGLAMSARSLPIGTAYAVWVGIGAAGTALFGMAFLGESREPARVLGVLCIITGITLLKLAHK